MHPKQAKSELESAIVAAGKQLARLRPAEGIQIVLNFYRTVRAEGCDMEQDGDMLLFQYGIWHETNRFGLDITRQLILEGGTDEDIWQLSLSFEFMALPDLKAIGNGDRWCTSLSEVDEFERFVAVHATMLALGDREDGQVRLACERVG